ncbi:MAG TPA: GNAT family N-acetyltransferase [Solirubrobacteraceae bacterium]|nr:GNAT family N-acetyltransferase [Solirubrobacteraceae bacterium]
MELAPEYPVATARLLLRPLSVSDIDALVAYRSLEEVCRFVPFEPMSAEAVTSRLREGWSRRTIAAEGDAVTLGVELVQARQLIGDVVLFFRSAEHRSGEVGWVFHPGFSGRGYATEAAHALLHLAFDDLRLHRVIARIDARNDASLRLGARLGMRQEAHLISNEWFKGDWSDEIDVALLEHEWVAQHADSSLWCDSPSAPSSTAAG